MLQDPMALPKLEEYEESLKSGPAKPGAGAPGSDAHIVASPDPTLNPYLATPYDPSGAASAEDLFGPDAALDPLRSLGARSDGPSAGAGARPSPGLTDPLDPSAAPIGKMPDAAASGFKDPTIELENGGIGRAAVESGDLISPQPGVYSRPASKPAAHNSIGDPSGLLGFNPYDANSILAPSRSTAAGASGAGLAAGLAPSGPLSGGLGGSLGSAGSLNSALPSSLASPLGPASRGPLR